MVANLFRQSIVNRLFLFVLKLSSSLDHSNRLAVLQYAPEGALGYLAQLGCVVLSQLNEGHLFVVASGSSVHVDVVWCEEVAL